MVAKVSLFEYLKDVDYLTKQVERLEQGRAEEILKI